MASPTTDMRLVIANYLKAFNCVLFAFADPGLPQGDCDLLFYSIYSLQVGEE